jgi:hypothetical protein
MYKLQKVKGEGVKTIIETTRPSRVKAKTSFMQSVGKKFSSGARMTKGVISKGIKIGAIGAGLTLAGYAAGAPSRRYAKAPKPGEDRDLRDMILSQPDKRQRY